MNSAATGKASNPAFSGYPNARLQMLEPPHSRWERYPPDDLSIFPEVLLDDEFPPHGLRIGVEHEPQPEDGQRNRHRDEDLPRVPGEERSDAQSRYCQNPRGQAQAAGIANAKDLYSRPDSHGNTRHDGEKRSARKGDGAPVEQGEERQEDPEDLGRVRQKGRP